MDIHDDDHTDRPSHQGWEWAQREWRNWYGKTDKWQSQIYPLLCSCPSELYTTFSMKNWGTIECVRVRQQGVWQKTQDSQCMYKRNIEAHSLRETIVAMESNKYYIFWVCVCICALIIQHAECIHCIILSSVYSVVVPYFSTLSHFPKKVTERKMCVLFFSTYFVWNISHSKKNSARFYDKCTYVFI
jgi:hypothetical protein